MITLTKTSNKYLLNFHEKEILLNFCELLKFRNRIESIYIDAHFYNDHSGIEIVTLCNRQHILILETTDIVVIKKKLQQLFTPLETEIVS